MTTTYTVRYKFARPDFNTKPWHDILNGTLDQIDAALYNVSVMAGAAAWAHSTDYTAGDLAIDEDLGLLWLCVTDHTSASSGTFADDRTANSGYWTQASGGVNGPVTNTDGNIPQWDGTNSNTLKNGVSLSSLCQAANNLNDVASAATAFSNIKQAATTGATGVVEIATGAEANALTDTTRVITPDTLNDAAELCVSTPAGEGTGATIKAAIQELQLAMFSTGDVKFTLKATADTGWVMMDDGTIGNAASGATTRANADTEALFTLLWNNVSDTYAPVSGGRGASAAADYAANKTIALTKVLGRALGAAGAGSGLTSRSLGQTVGAETETISQAKLPNVNFVVDIPSGQGSHTHGYSRTNEANLKGGSTGNVNSGAYGTQTDAATLPALSGTAASGGSGTPANIMQPTLFLNVMVKL